jgi:DNA-directed RNA polymerase specialized sigma24 family protein
LSETTSSRMEHALAQAGRGDAAAFESIVREFQGMVFSLAYHFLHDRALAEDMAQEVFLHLFRNLRSIQSPEHLKFWLRKVATVDEEDAVVIEVKINPDQLSRCIDEW